MARLSPNRKKHVDDWMNIKSALVVRNPMRTSTLIKSHDIIDTELSRLEKKYADYDLPEEFTLKEYKELDEFVTIKEYQEDE